MKNFKDFSKSLNETSKDISPGAIVNGTPSAVVFHGSHSVDPIDQGKMIDGVPCAVVFHGSHSGILTNQQTRTLKEDSSIGDWANHNENSHIHPDRFKVGSILGMHQKREGMDSHHLNKYTEGSRVLNKVMYQAHANGEAAPKTVHGFNGVEHNVKRLDDAVTRNKLHKDVHLYSGVGFEPSKLASQHPEGHIHLPAFTSTSISKHVARNFAATQGEDKKTTLRHSGLKGHILHIHAHEGQPAAYVENETAYKMEHEVLLPRGTTIKVHGHSDHEDDFGDKYRVHHCTIVNKK